MFMHDVKRSARAWLPAVGGNIGLVFALAVVPIVGLAGAALDYSRASNTRSQLQSLADAAALDAARAPTQGEAKKIVAAWLGTKADASTKQWKMQAKLAEWKAGSATVVFEGVVPATLMAVLGSGPMPLEVTASASIAEASYLDVHLAVDFSGSLNVPSTPAERAKFEALTKPYSNTWWHSAGIPQGCMYACHTREGWEPPGKTAYQMARDAGIRLREDDLAAAVEVLIGAALSNSSKGGDSRRRLGLIGFSQYAKTLHAPTSNAAAVKSAVKNFPEKDRLGTYFETVMPTVAKIVGSGGAGTTSTSPRKLLVLITDGLRSFQGDGPRWPLPEEFCKNLKGQNVTLAVVDVQYVAAPENAFFNADVGMPLWNQLSPALKACASPGWYFRASDTPEITKRFQDLLAKIDTTFSPLRLTH
jgi:hypothetical protein